MGIDNGMFVTSRSGIEKTPCQDRAVPVSQRLGRAANWLFEFAIGLDLTRETRYRRALDITG